MLDVVSVPAGHPYVQHLLPLDPASARVRYRPDLDPDDPGRPASGRWWPPVALDPAWLERQSCDVLHLHFGFDDATPARLARLLEVARRRRIATVLTVHDLRSPHQLDPAVLDAQLDVLVTGVDAVVTLTPAAAGEIRRRWGRAATVLAHPHVVDLATAARLRADRIRRRYDDPGSRVVGLAVKSLRRNTDPVALLPALQRAVAARSATTLRVSAHHELRHRDDADARAVVRALDDAAEDRRTQVVWHDRLDDEALAESLAALDVAVLPYRFGTHSGWLEACHDVGTRVLAPDHGCYASQGADGGYADTATLERELARLLAADARSPVGAEPAERAAQRERLAAAHEELYRSLLADGGGGR